MTAHPGLASLAVLLGACSGSGAAASDAARAPDAAPVDAMAGNAPLAPDAADARPLAACEAEVVGPAAPLAVADRGVTESTLALPLAGVARVRELTVTVDLVHPYPRDLTLSLVSPAGTSVALSRRRGTGAGYLATTFDDHAAVAIAEGSGSFSGAFRPDEPLARFRGEDSTGAWTLRVADLAAGDIGTLRSWAIRINACPDPECHGGHLRLEREFVFPFPDPEEARVLFVAVLDPAVTVLAARASLVTDYRFDEDLHISLWSPASSRVDLSSRNGGLGRGYDGTVFDDNAATAVVDGAAPFDGAFRPEEPLARLAGERAGGPWILSVLSDAPRDQVPEDFMVRRAALELDTCELACPLGSRARRVTAPPDTAEVAVDDPGTVTALGVWLSASQDPAVPAGLRLRAPSGMEVALSGDAPAGEHSGTFFVDGAARPLTAELPPWSGAFRPSVPLATLAGQPAVGSWRLLGAASVGELALDLCVR